MPTHQLGDAHVNAALSTVSLAFVQSKENFIATKVFPNVPVQNMSGLYWKYPRGLYFRTDVQRRAPGQPAAETSFRRESAAYLTQVDAIKSMVTDQERRNADSVFDLDRDATLLLTEQHLVKRETNWAGKYFTTGVWTVDITGVPGAPGAGQTQQWDQAASDPINFIQGERMLMLERTGVEPNLLVVSPHVRIALENHPVVQERYKYTAQQIAGAFNLQGGASVPALSVLAQVFGVERVLEAKAVHNTDSDVNDGAPGSIADGDPAGMGFVFPKSALLCYTPPAPSTLTPAAGYTFSWNGYLGASNEGMRTKKYRDEVRASDAIEVEMAYDQHVISADLGQFYTTIVA